MTTKVDLLVLGGGSGGMATARRAAKHKAGKIVLIEEKRMGGTCVNVGCVPKKCMWSVADLLDDLRHSGPAMGIETAGLRLNFEQLKARRDAYVQRLNGIYEGNLGRDGIELVHGHCQFVGQRQVEVNGTVYEAEHVLIATGGRPAVPSVPGAELGITSDGFFDLPALPRRVAVAGAGYIAVELAGVLASLGAEVSLLTRHATPLRTFDGTLQTALLEEMGKALPTFRHLPNTEIQSISRGEDGLKVELAGGPATFDCVVWAIGRQPNVELGLEKTGVELQAGHIAVDEYQNTSSPGIYALGDVCGRALLTPVAIAAGRRLAERLFNGQAGAKMDYELIPTVVFSHPPIGTVGLTEEQAVARHGAAAVKCYQSRFVNMFHFAMDPAKPRPTTTMKLVTLLPSEKILGMHAIGRAADELIQGFAVAVKMGATKADLDNTCAIHPTAAEEFVTMT